MENSKNLSMPRSRLESLDAFRGFTMLLLISGGFGMGYLRNYQYLGFFAKHFTHHQWHGMYFWDLIQPFFMFIVGVAMPFSFLRRWNCGDTWNQTFNHVIRRSLTLLLFCIILGIGWSNKIQIGLWNVLGQLAFTYFFAFLFMRFSLKKQLIISFAILLFNYILYRFVPVPGVTEPWVKGNNIGSYIDALVIGRVSPGGWVTINLIGSTAHTMWGVMAGIILKSERTHRQKIKILLIAGISGILLGLMLDPITPIVKRICTSSFIIHSGGWCILFLTLFYYIIDVKNYRKWSRFMTILGMNCIFIYMFKGILGGSINNYVSTFTMPVLKYLGVVGLIIHKNIIVFILWYLTYWLYKNKIFIKI
ncbi:acyltransferase family protein [candidate division KSB1 bacterium]